jgi:hypothetical protein
MSMTRRVFDGDTRTYFAVARPMTSSSIGTFAMVCPATVLDLRGGAERDVFRIAIIDFLRRYRVDLQKTAPTDATLHRQRSSCCSTYCSA